MDINQHFFKKVPLAPLNTWQIGGNAAYFFEPPSIDALVAFFKSKDWIIDDNIPVYWLGLGSNILVPDEGLSGLVIATRGLDKITLLAPNKVYVEAGVTCAKLAKFCTRHGLEGAAFFAGIPGAVGGALRMNAGAWSGETWRFVKAVETVNRLGERKNRLAADFKVGYREVLGLEIIKDEGFVAGIFEFELAQDPKIAEQKIKQLLRERAEKQPIGTRNCGSVFRNPENDFAARLIESCGLKGKRIGGAVISLKHANFIINDNNATASDIKMLIQSVIDTVFTKTGVTLVPEVKILGFTGSVNPWN